MDTIFVVIAGVFLSAAIYLMLSRHIVRLLIGLVLLGNAVNLAIFTAGRITRESPPLIGADAVVASSGTSNPLPQALILTAIVISFSFFVLLSVLAFRAYQDLSTDDTDAMRAAEPADVVPPPEGY